ncbi:transposase [Candidatus Hakubella thermalkaliphila]|uniref:Transposase n=1 Tax=Candidatus Hakubella thermalkaliphila TaxID=2754717 RepID=A0A6V8NQS8_9ACTN|nr:transposase [Candidatus Hakubella thermalkaliphila]GFP20756.1 transposase [Candidatus Hakubella thermalkaliphila]
MTRSKKTLTCPAGVVTEDTYRSETAHTTIYRFLEEKCNCCVLKNKCTNRQKGRTVSINDNYHLILKAKEYLSTDEGKAELKLRPSVERVNGVLKNRFGLGVTKSWGANKYKMQVY